MLKYMGKYPAFKAVPNIAKYGSGCIILWEFLFLFFYSRDRDA